MLRHLALVLTLLAAAGGTAFAAPPEGVQPPAQIAAALTEDVVEIRSTFAGAELTLYGAATGLQEGDDIVVAVRGPAGDLRVMQKRRVLGIWINAAPVRFEDVAGYYAVASTRPLSDFASFSALRRNQIGMDHVRLYAPESIRRETLFGVRNVMVTDLGGEIVDYRAALVRNKARRGLYGEAPGGVELLEGGLFRARVILPPTTPTGTYNADVYLFRDGQPIATRRTDLTVVKAGVERAIYDLAQNRPVVYAFISVLLAMLAGWTAAAVTQRR
jgi:uncharacterized protein (TIGR02186 family)